MEPKLFSAGSLDETQAISEGREEFLYSLAGKLISVGSI